MTSPRMRLSRLAGDRSLRRSVGQSGKAPDGDERRDVTPGSRVSGEGARLSGSPPRTTIAVVVFVGASHAEVAHALADWLAGDSDRQAWSARFVLSHDDDDEVSLHAIVVQEPRRDGF